MCRNEWGNCSQEELTGVFEGAPGLDLKPSDGSEFPTLYCASPPVGYSSGHANNVHPPRKHSDARNATHGQWASVLLLSRHRLSVQPSIAKIVIADATATWVSNITLSMAGTTPSNWTMALPRDIVILAESEVDVSADLGRLAELQPGLIAEVGFFCGMGGRRRVCEVNPNEAFQVLQL